MPAVHIDLWRLSLITIVSICLPLLIGFVADQFVDFVLPLALVAGMLTLPFTIFFVCRAVLAEMDRVIAIVAPEETAEDLGAVEER